MHHGPLLSSYTIVYIFMVVLLNMYLDMCAPNVVDVVLLWNMWNALRQYIQWNLYACIKTTIGTNKMWSWYKRWSLYAGSITWKVYPWRPAKCGLYKQVVFIYRWSWEQVWLYMKCAFSSRKITMFFFFLVTDVAWPVRSVVITLSCTEEWTCCLAMCICFVYKGFWMYDFLVLYFAWIKHLIFMHFFFFQYTFHHKHKDQVFTMRGLAFPL